MPKTPGAFRLVLVEWHASEYTDGWSSIDEPSEPSVGCWTIGWLLKETNDSLWVSSTLNTGAREACGAVHIPKVSVIQMQEVALSIPQGATVTSTPSNPSDTEN